MIKILHILDGLNLGGAESFILNYFRIIDKNKYTFDFLIRNSNYNEKIYNEIISLGGKVFIVKNYLSNIFSNHINTKKIIEKGGYDVIHIHANSLMYFYPIKISNKLKVPKVIIHSHSTKTLNPIYLPIHILNRKRLHKYNNIFLACSNDAGRWMYKENFLIINNAIDEAKFAYDRNIEKREKKEFNLSDETWILCNVGRFVDVKNHDFLLKCFRNLLNIHNNSVLILIGNGPKEAVIKQEISKLNIDEKVIILKSRNDVNELLQMCDIFVSTSFFEGIPLALIEAQAADLTILASNNISKDANISDRFEMLSLEAGETIWAQRIYELIQKYKGKKRDNRELIAKKGFSSKVELKKLENIYDK